MGNPPKKPLPLSAIMTENDDQSQRTEARRDDQVDVVGRHDPSAA